MTIRDAIFLIRVPQLFKSVPVLVVRIVGSVTCPAAIQPIGVDGCRIRDDTQATLHFVKGSTYKTGFLGYMISRYLSPSGVWC